jgi:hypothetical protein
MRMKGFGIIEHWNTFLVFLSVVDVFFHIVSNLENLITPPFSRRLKDEKFLWPHHSSIELPVLSRVIPALVTYNNTFLMPL